MGGEKDIIIWFIAFLGVFYALWIFGGGPQKYEQIDQPYLKPVAPLNTGKDFGTPFNIPNKVDTTLNLGGKATASPAETVGDKEDVSSEFPKVKISVLTDGDIKYLEILALLTNKNPIKLTGWEIRNTVNAERFIVGKGVKTLKQGDINEVKDIYLNAGEKALILAGDSPIGYSFELNKCTGYLEQFQDFIPSLPIMCPNPVILPQISGLSDKNCVFYITSMPQCRIPTGNYPISVTEDCKKIINKEISHNSCVENFKNDKDFYFGEWRVYLDANELGNSKGDILRIRDSEGRLVDTLFFGPK